MKHISLHVDYLPVNMKNAAILEMGAPAVKESYVVFLIG
jgi:hypothetical protein